MSDETLERIAGWCEAERDLELEGNTITVAGHPPVQIEAVVDDDALTLTHLHAVADPPAGFAEGAVEMLNERGSMVSGEVLTGTDETEVHVRYPIYLEGLNRQSFAVAVREVTRTVDGLRRLESSSARAVSAAAAGSGPAPPPSQDEPAGETPKPQPAAKPAAAAAPAASTAPWAATHQVPPTGMPAWGEPNPSLAPATNLAAGLPLRVDETRGAWASVTASNGWKGWVDARILQPVGAAGAPWSAPAAAGGSWAGHQGGGLAVVPLIGGIMVVVAAFLAWGDWTYGTGMDTSMWVIWPLSEVETFWSWSQPRIGLILIIAGVLGVLGASLPKFPTALRILGGVLAILLAAGVILRIGLDWSFGEVFRFDFTGAFVALVGGVLTLITGRRMG